MLISFRRTTTDNARIRSDSALPLTTILIDADTQFNIVTAFFNFLYLYDAEHFAPAAVNSILILYLRYVHQRHFKFPLIM